MGAGITVRSPGPSRKISSSIARAPSRCASWWRRALRPSVARSSLRCRLMLVGRPRAAPPTAHCPQPVGPTTALPRASPRRRPHRSGTTTRARPSGTLGAIAGQSRRVRRAPLRHCRGARERPFVAGRQLPMIGTALAPAAPGPPKGRGPPAFFFFKNFFLFSFFFFY